MWLIRAGVSDSGIEKMGWWLFLFPGSRIKGQAMIIKCSEFRTDKTNTQMNLFQYLCAEDIVTAYNGNPNERQS